MGLAVICQITMTGSAGAATAATAATAAMTGTSVATGAVPANSVSQVDCNGWSHKYQAVAHEAGMFCTDVRGSEHGKPARFEDNGKYIGHDEPSVKFISSQPGSGNAMTYAMKLPHDPVAAPTANSSVVDYAQLSVAPWFGLPMCDPKSYPQNPCTPDSDSNTGFNSPSDAGSAFMELQFYPPGFTPTFTDSTSCDATRWCAALNIDSLACTFGFQTCNNNCIEPVNFAFLQTNGVPTGPPNPQQATVHSYTPNAHTLMMNPGDVIVTSISDPKAGFTAVVRDLTTHQTGFMTASAANGFMNTNIADCSGTPFTFHAEYSTAQQQNQVPWAALQGGVLMQQEIGHGEVCNSLAHQDPAINPSGGKGFTDPQVFDTCIGGAEGPNTVGEGPCNANSGVCHNATTQGGVACPVNKFTTNFLCEFADGYCFPKGTRTATIDGSPVTETSRAAECYNSRFQNGDLDFEGQSYLPDWPNGSPNFPTTFQYVGPFTGSGNIYPQVQYETDAPGSEIQCDIPSGSGCLVPPAGAKFYPFWSLGPLVTGMGGHNAGCAWNFGNDQPNTIMDFGKDAQYGVPDVALFGGTSISAVLPNPQFSARCLLR